MYPFSPPLTHPASLSLYLSRSLSLSLSCISGSGKELSYVDLMYTPFLERMAASIPYFKGIEVRRNPRWPNIDR